MDAVINHMCGDGSGTGYGSAGSWYNSHEKLFAGVPYGPDDFNCCPCPHRCTTSSCNIESYSDAQQVPAFMCDVTTHRQTAGQVGTTGLIQGSILFCRP